MTFDKHIGTEFDDLGDGEGALIRILPHHMSPTGNINGGVIISMADNLSLSTTPVNFSTPCWRQRMIN